MALKIDRKKCTGCGTCSAICSEVFEIGDDGKACIKKNANKKSACIKEAIASCPVEAISE